jgi:hypothetical protein
MATITPRGVEVLVKKASVDPGFKKTLLAKRADAAEDIALKLEPAEAAMLDAVPAEQLRAIINRTKVSPNLRPAFLGTVAAVMLAALASKTPAEDLKIKVKSYGVDAEVPPGIVDPPPITPATETVGSGESGHGKVSGIVKDNRGNPMPDALVTVSGTKLFTATNADGSFIITPVPAGFVTVEAFSTEYGSIERTNVKILADYTTVLTFQYENPPLKVPEKPRVIFNKGGYHGISPDIPPKEGD